MKYHLTSAQVSAKLNNVLNRLKIKSERTNKKYQLHLRNNFNNKKINTPPPEIKLSEN